MKKFHIRIVAVYILLYLIALVFVFLFDAWADFCTDIHQHGIAPKIEKLWYGKDGRKPCPESLPGQRRRE